MNELLYPYSIFESLRPLSAFCFIHIRPFAQPRWHSYADVLLMFFSFFFFCGSKYCSWREKQMSKPALLPSSAQLSDIIVSPQSSSRPGLAGRCRLILDAILHSVGFLYLCPNGKPAAEAPRITSSACLLFTSSLLIQFNKNNKLGGQTIIF